jgi:hypothetical protein
MVAGVTLTFVTLLAYSFYQHSSLMAEYLSEPQLMMRGRGRNGGTIMIDDFREAYWWVRDNTPKDSRIMCVSGLSVPIAAAIFVTRSSCRGGTMVTS